RPHAFPQPLRGGTSARSRPALFATGFQGVVPVPGGWVVHGAAGTAARVPHLLLRSGLSGNRPADHRGSHREFEANRRRARHRLGICAAARLLERERVAPAVRFPAILADGALASFPSRDRQGAGDLDRQTRTVLSAAATAMASPPFENASDITSPVCGKRVRALPVAASRMLTTPPRFQSPSLVASFVPSGENATATMSPEPGSEYCSFQSFVD